MEAPTPPVLLITDRRQARLPLADIVAAALAGGCRWISVREKDLPGEAQVALARELDRVAAPYGARVMLHGDPQLALQAGLRGVHLASNGDVRAARSLLGLEAWVSISTHAANEIEGAAASGADAVTLSPIFASRSKPGYGPPVGLEALARAAEKSPIPIIALGGIEDAPSARACFEAGAAAVAVMGAVMRADDPAAAVTVLVRAALADHASRRIQ